MCTEVMLLLSPLVLPSDVLVAVIVSFSLAGCVCGEGQVRVELPKASFLAFLLAPNLSAVELPASTLIGGCSLATTSTDRCNHYRHSHFRRMLRSSSPFVLVVLLCYRCVRLEGRASSRPPTFVLDLCVSVLELPAYTDKHGSPMLRYRFIACPFSLAFFMSM